MEKNPQVDAYLDKLAPDRKSALEQLRAFVSEAMPNIRETVRYNMPTYEMGDSIVCAFASQKNYISFYMDPEVVAKHKGELGADCGKSCIRFRRLDDKLSNTLRIMLAESAQNRAMQA